MDIDRSNDLFEYPSACVGRRIRLLKLLHASDTDQLSFFLEEADLDSSEIDFIAISYVWGDPHDTKMVICNGKAINITRSLYSALWQWRDQGCRAHIWADAICINQNNMMEKTEQVRMMGDIYSRANIVIIWLGELAEDDLIGIGLMKHIRDVLKEESPVNLAAQPDLTSLGLFDIADSS